MSEKEQMEFVTGEPAWGRQSVYHAPADVPEGETAPPINIADPRTNEVVSLTASPIHGPTNRYHKGKLTWGVRYSNGDMFYQYDADGTARPTQEIVRKNLRAFILFNGNSVLFAQEFQPGQEFIYRRRSAMRTGQDVIEVIHVVGWRKKTKVDEREQYVSNINFIYESDLHIESGEFLFTEEEGYGNPEQWRYPPEFVDDDYIVIE